MMGKPVLYGDLARWGLVQADAFDLLATLPAASVDCLLTDPPYAINIAGWDGREIRRRVAAGGERLSPGEAFERWTAGWAREARRVSKPGAHIVAFGAPRTAHRLTAGLEDAGLEIRDVIIWANGQGVPKSRRMPGGLGVALKPSYELAVIARAPLAGTTAENLERFGTGALNIDAARIESPGYPGGYWPANLTLSHAPTCTPAACASGCPVEAIDRIDVKANPSRLFFCAKASKAEREAGCEQLPKRSMQLYPQGGPPSKPRANVHPCVKPIRLLRWLTRLAAPSGGLVLDPFAGSGSVGAAALLEGRQFLGVEKEREYVQIARARLAHWAAAAGREDGPP